MSIGIVLAALLLSGCTTRHQIRPTELPKLNAAGTSSGSNGNDAVLVLTVRQLRSVDGTLFEVKGDTPVYITTRTHEEFEFYPPIHVEIKGDELTISSAYRAPMTLHRDAIVKVEVETYDGE